MKFPMIILVGIAFTTSAAIAALQAENESVDVSGRMDTHTYKMYTKEQVAPRECFDRTGSAHEKRRAVDERRGECKDRHYKSHERGERGNERLEERAIGSRSVSGSSGDEGRSDILAYQITLAPGVVLASVAVTTTSTAASTALAIPTGGQKENKGGKGDKGDKSHRKNHHHHHHHHQDHGKGKYNGTTHRGRISTQ